MTLNCKGQLIDLDRPKTMGIINLTPDSFYDGGRLKNDLDVLQKVEEHLEHGAQFIDLGGYSSKPGAAHVSLQEEHQRVINSLQSIQKAFPECLISVDTFRAEIAEAAIENGAAIINDISAGQLDAKMLPLVAQHQVCYIGMHMKGTPQNMQEHTTYEHLITDLKFYFSALEEQATQLQIHDLILDVGFGFSKTLEQNFQLLNSLEAFHIFKRPILVGLSRKSMIYKTLQLDAEQALNGTSALHMTALSKGAHILRVHDVKEAEQCIALHMSLKENK